MCYYWPRHFVRPIMSLRSTIPLQGDKLIIMMHMLTDSMCYTDWTLLQSPAWSSVGKAIIN